MIEFIPFLAEAGFCLLDVNLCEMMNEDSLLRGPQRSAYVKQLQSYQKQYGLEYHQAHAPYTHDRFGMAKEEGRQLDELIFASIEIAGELGVGHVVLHAATDFVTPSLSLEKNLDWLHPFVNKAKEAGTAIALENLDYSKTKIPEYTSQASELVALIDAFDSPLISACYDFGHAHLAKVDHRQFLLALGNRLSCLHVADNHGDSDEHLMPFYGTVPWEICMRTLKEIGYQGELTYEVMFFTQHLPQQLHRSFLHHAMDVGIYLVDLFAKAPGPS